MSKRMTEKEKARFTQMFKHSAMKKATEIDREADEIRTKVATATRVEAIKALGLEKPMKAVDGLRKKVEELNVKRAELLRPIGKELGEVRAQIHSLVRATRGKCEQDIDAMIGQHNLKAPRNWYNHCESLDGWANYLTKMLTDSRPDPAKDLMEHKAKVLENATQFTDAVYLADSAEQAMELLIALAEMFELELPPAMALLIKQQDKLKK